MHFKLDFKEKMSTMKKLEEKMALFFEKSERFLLCFRDFDAFVCNIHI